MPFWIPGPPAGHFKDRFSMEDEPVAKSMDEVKAYGDRNEISLADERSSHNGLQPSPNKKGKFSSIFGTASPPSSMSMNTGTTSVSKQCKREFEMYLQFSSLDINGSPLQLWKLKCKRLPSLSIAARKYLCVCATRIMSERVFSIGGQVVNNRYNCSKPHKVSSLIFLAKNLHSQK